jgi:membrane fusion protein, multidrug efflux system
MRTIYVAANFKETQTARMLIGQRVRFSVDALPGRTFEGEVESFAPASGSEFSLLPFEPATGNFTRIVQRVPVRIRVLPGQQDSERLRPGLSADVTVELEK